jgi:hypothetical protein
MANLLKGISSKEPNLLEKSNAGNSSANLPFANG